MSSLDYLDLCRLCLVKDRVGISIFEDDGDVRQVFLKIASCLPVKVSREDKLPKKICDDCMYKLELFYQFWNTTANAEKQLLQWLDDVDMQDKQGYVTEVLNSSIMKQEQQASENRLDESVMQVSHQNNMGMGMMDNMGLGMPIIISTTNQPMTSVPMDTSGSSVQTIQAVPGTSTQSTHDQISQNQSANVGHHEVDEDSDEDEENESDDECDADDGLPVKEENEEDPNNRTVEPTTFVNVSLPCDEAGPSGLQQQKITEMPEMAMPQVASADNKTGKLTRWHNYYKSLKSKIQHNDHSTPVNRFPRLGNSNLHSKSVENKNSIEVNGKLGEKSKETPDSFCENPNTLETIEISDIEEFDPVSPSSIYFENENVSNYFEQINAEEFTLNRENSFKKRNETSEIEEIDIEGFDSNSKILSNNQNVVSKGENEKEKEKKEEEEEKEVDIEEFDPKRNFSRNQNTSESEEIDIEGFDSLSNSNDDSSAKKKSSDSVEIDIEGDDSFFTDSDKSSTFIKSKNKNTKKIDKIVNKNFSNNLSNDSEDIDIEEYNSPTTLIESPKNIYKTRLKSKNHNGKTSNNSSDLSKMEHDQNTPRIKRRRRKRRILRNNSQCKRNIAKEFSPQKQEFENDVTSRNSPPENNSIERNLRSRKFAHEKNISREIYPQKYNSLKLQKARKRLKNTSSDDSENSRESNSNILKSKQIRKRVKNNSETSEDVLEGKEIEKKEKNNFPCTCKNSALNSSGKDSSKKKETKKPDGNLNEIESNILKSKEMEKSGKNNSPGVSSSKDCLKQNEDKKSRTNETITFEPNSEEISKLKQTIEEQKNTEKGKEINSLDSSSKEKETTKVDILIKEYSRPTKKYVQTFIKVTKKSLQIEVNNNFNSTGTSNLNNKSETTDNNDAYKDINDNENCDSKELSLLIKKENFYQESSEK
ncbi:TNF receptor-associated factor family protein DDB_G0272098-like isoform X3 [Leptopilina heterotoma]|uniref:TNF receptor-associated factor family protein DDB_G0272098-like isoform X3 n=1 Tax=Leptopilina heterotoma TaxID=63436 RepID=UPI001CA7F949|nr:TNF receptor-associated factor family protein DDB_G0272098-like isoform X3 [Leptopilina heterotoma]